MQKWPNTLEAFYLAVFSCNNVVIVSQKIVSQTNYNFLNGWAKHFHGIYCGQNLEMKNNIKGPWTTLGVVSIGAVLVLFQAFWYNRV